VTARRARIPVAQHEPITCTLDTDGARAQIDEWQSLLSATVVSTQRDDPATTRMELAPDCDVAAIVALARREVACCSFFRFAIEIGPRASTLVVSVPAEAAPILDAFTALAQTYG
jgi:hypothetical protein